MEYLEAVSLVKEVEQKYDVMSVKYKGISIWPMLRTFIFTEKTDDQKPFSANKGTVMTVLKGMFFYSLAPLFRRHDVWVMTTSRERKIVKDRFINRTMGALSHVDENVLFWESSTPFVPNYPKEQIEEKNIVSGNIFLFIRYFIKYMMFWKKPKLDNESVLKQICRDYNYDFDYMGYMRRFYGEKKAADIMLALLPKPKKVFLVCSYRSVGTICSFKKHGIEVVELQHGVLNKYHFGYNPTYASKELYPDVMGVMGEVEYDYFTRENTNFCPRIEKVGLYMLDYAKQVFNEDLFAEYRKKYKAVIVIAGQKPQESEMQHFFNELAGRKPDYLFIYVPREPTTSNEMKEENTLFKPGVNIYEYLKWCDLHCTLSSTTCLESQFFSKGTLFWDLNNDASIYYGNVLKQENGVSYVKTVDEAEIEIEHLLYNDFKYRDFFYQGNEDNIRRIISE